MKLHPLFAVAAGLAGLATAPQAATVTYSIDPAQSSLRMTANYSNIPLTEQAAGSLTDSYSGTITGDLVGSTITFAGSSAIVANLHPSAPFAPTPSVAGSVDNYGGNVLTATIAFRSIVLDIASGTATHGSATTAPLSFTSGHADYDAVSLGVGVGTINLIGQSAANAAVGAVTIVTSGSTETLTIPVSITYPGDVTALFEGQIVAVRTVPEPASLAFGALGLAALLRRRR